eukprot:gene11452-23951_t
MVDYSKWDTFCENLSDDDEERMPSVTKLDDSSKIHIGPKGVSISSTPEKATKNCLHNEKDENFSGGKTSNFDWDQSRQDVYIEAGVPFESKSSKIRPILNEGDLSFWLESNKILGGKLKYPIEENSADDVDWELMTRTNTSGEVSKVLSITLRKKSIIPGATLWWSCVFQGDPEIDVTAIKGRNMANTASWEEAQKLFKERIAERELIDIDTNSA